LPQRDIDHLRVVRIDDQLVGAGLVVTEQDLVPRLAAVFRTVHAALRIRGRVMTEGRDVHHIRVRGMDADFRNYLGFGQADVRPRLAAISRLVRAAALDDVAADVGLAGADVDDVWIRGRDGHRTDRRVIDQTVGHRLPRSAAVGRLPETAAGRA